MDPITYGTVCSGIESPSVAWEGLGWAPTFFSEIEAFPRQVLRQRQRAVSASQSGAAALGTPLWGDFTAMRMRFFRRLGIRLPDVLCGGTPCQAFSLAGLRQSLDDARGNLTLEYVRLANAIDNERFRLGKPGLVVLWENVPGVLSTKDNAFGCFLAGLVGADTPLVPPPGLRWTDAGLVAGPRRNAAWRVLDSQYFGLAQRRRRVFVVGCPVDGPDPSEILPEQEGLRRDHPPRREAQKNPAGRPAGDAASDPSQSLTGTPRTFVSDVAPTIPSRTTAGGGMGSDFDFDGGLVAVQAFGGNNTSGPIDVATALNASHTASGRPDFETETLVCQPAYPILEVGARTGASTSDPRAGIGIGDDGDPMFTLQAGKQHGVVTAYRTAGDGAVYEEGNVTAPLTTGTDACASVVAFSCKDHGGDASDVAPTLRAMGHEASHMNGGGQVAVAVSLRGREGGGSAELGGDVMPALRCGGGGGDKPHAMMASGVRRLMPVECERLQGFPDNYTLIPWKVADRPIAKEGKTVNLWEAQRQYTGLGPDGQLIFCPDGHRYKALGNSMSVPVMAWIGRRIERAIRAHRMGSAA